MVCEKLQSFDSENSSMPRDIYFKTNIFRGTPAMPFLPRVQSGIPCDYPLIYELPVSGSNGNPPLKEESLGFWALTLGPMIGESLSTMYFAQKFSYRTSSDDNTAEGN